MSHAPALIFFAVFIAIIGTFLFRVLKYGGFKAAMFGGRIENTLGEVIGTGRAMGKVKLKIHQLDRADEDHAVAIELVATTIASYQMLPITLSAEATRELIGLLQEALGDAH